MDQGQAGIWWPERQLADALRTTRSMLGRIASERIWSELKRILLGQHASEIVQRMADDGILKQILDLDWEQDDLRIRLLNDIDGTDVIDRLVVMLRDFSTMECEQLARTLRLSGQEKKRLLFRHAKLGHLPEDTESNMRICRRYGDMGGTTPLHRKRCLLKTIPHSIIQRNRFNDG